MVKLGTSLTVRLRQLVKGLCLNHNKNSLEVPILKTEHALL